MGGHFKKGTPDEIAIQEDINSRKGVERIIREAFELAKRTGKTKVAMADKHNAMMHAHELWIRCFREVAEEYPDIETRHVFVDAMCLFLVQDPSQFEVVVTCKPVRRHHHRPRRGAAGRDGHGGEWQHPPG